MSQPDMSNGWINTIQKLFPQTSPKEEIAKRSGDYLPGLATAARLIGLEDHRANLADHRDRVRHSHAVQQKVLGVLPVDYKQENGIDVGDLSVSGDTYQYHAPKATNWTLPAIALIGAASYLGYLYLNQTPTDQPPLTPTVDMVVEPPPSSS